jgi:hypothetical protein
MFGKIYHIENADKRIHYELVSDPTRLSLVSIWKHNRPPDPTRIKEIKEHIQKTKMCDGQILLAIVDKKCICYDGGHRLFACKEFFPDGGVQIRIIHESSENEIRREFERINRSIPVPELYFSKDEISRRITTLSQAVAKSLCTHYPKYVSTSRRPRRPNFNRDKFVEDIGEVLQNNLTSEQITTLSEDQIGKWLTNINHIIYSNRETYIKASPSIISKCEIQKLFIFAANWKDILSKHIKTSFYVS